jgi:diguanylate cyclase (GGDEF)-like protein
MKDENSNKVILVVDDDELVRMTLSVLISSLGYTCLLAEDGCEAVELLKETPVDLVFSDIIMPNMNGLELLAHTREHHPDVDVIIATGYSEQAGYAEVIKAGAIDFIKKPIDQAELEAKLARAFREREIINRLEMLSMQDGLTGLLNRRAFDMRYHEEIERANRQGYPLFLAIVDVDNFKEYNDTYGHLKGDDLLVELGQILSQCTRQSVDFTFRLGGDEFAVLLPNTTADQATEIVQRILLSFIEKSYGKTTLSIGITSCEIDREALREEEESRIKERADQAMYSAKENGKNCVICKMK